MKNIAQSFLIEGNLETNPKLIAKAFNNFFVKIGESLAEAFIGYPEYSLNIRVPGNVNFEIPQLKPDFVLKQLQTMDPHKATGLDGISSRSLKSGAPCIYMSLTKVLNLSITTGKFIDIWKVAKVIPLYKSGDSFEVCNYRPISILSVPSKILERHVHSTFNCYLESNNLVTKEQSGFRSKHSCDTALIKMTDDWLTNINSGMITGVIYIDLKKAFDTVNHKLLIQKLSAYGVSGQSLCWFQSYLEQRSQKVHWNGESSDSELVTVGVPQGSILGPLLFTIFVNDLPESVDQPLHLYADDGTLQCQARTIYELEQKLTHSFGLIVDWMKKNRLTVHLGKTKVQLIGSYRKVPILISYMRVNSPCDTKLCYSGLQL